MSKKCEICGREMPESEFSKSYKKRCKECVAVITREKRSMVNLPTVKTEADLRTLWEARRFDLAKAAMVAMIGKKGNNYLSVIAMDAVELANNVIKELRKEY